MKKLLQILDENNFRSKIDSFGDDNDIGYSLLIEFGIKFEKIAFSNSTCPGHWIQVSILMQPLMEFSIL